MPAAKTETEQRGIPWQKGVADFCTAARGPLAVTLVWLGIAREKEGIQLAFVLLLVAATLDTLDGYFARVSSVHVQTWIGSHDLAFDILFSAALLAYLAISGYVSPLLAIVYIGVWTLIFGNQAGLSNTLAVLSQAPIYGGVALAAVLDNIEILWWGGLWAAVMLAFAGQRFLTVRVPAFTSDLTAKIRHLKERKGH